MANVKQLRLRIKSIKSTKKITKAMQMVSAAKLRKSRIVLDGSSIYHNAVENAMHNVISADSDLSNLAKAVLGLKTHSKIKLFIVVGSDRGLCGGFNQLVLRLLRLDITHCLEHSIQFKIIVIGKKPAQIINAHYKDYVIETHNNLGFTTDELSSLSKRIMDMLSGDGEHRIGSCDIYFSSFKNTVTQVPTMKQILPVQIKKSNSVAHSLCEVEGENLVEELVTMYVIAQVQYAILDSRTSEEASRTTAMDNATRNANDMMEKLTLVMNRSRQSMITKELIEIISGAEAV
jgi:F-type H+-transporting ATPase subunit gamma